MSTLERAIAIAAVAHSGQLDRAGETFVLSSEPIWVRPVAHAVALDLTPLLS